MRFTKLHGYGNDYIVVEGEELGGFLTSFGEFAPLGVMPSEVGQLSRLVRAVCDRHEGAGADGVAVVEPVVGGGADFRLRIFNPDGSEAAMSGNGSRCAAAYLHFRGLWSKDELRLTTRAGVKLFQLRSRPAPGRYRFAAEIGQPAFESDSIPMQAGEPLAHVRDYPLAVGDGEALKVTALRMCNPNCCVFVEDFEAADWRRLGALVERHRQFPERTNVEFVRVVDRHSIEARVWERGAGETLSSGTGACAAAVACVVNDLTERRVRVRMPGGLLEVEWRADGEVVLTGEAEVVYSGVWLKETTTA
ncbi:MAG TPA: diaminopimelate epimerase [Pyrinomonadaceae bacterium]|nr:diaminopimelate epimerase [Pyrinomonadaceae bacterium]